MSNPAFHRPMTRSERRAAREGSSRAHGRPMRCPQCGNDIYLDAPHTCPPGFVKPAREILTFYGYKALNACCRSNWLLLGWPQVDGKPRNIDTRHLHFDCPKCGKALWFDVGNPDLEQVWDEARQGKAPPPALVAGNITKTP